MNRLLQFAFLIVTATLPPVAQSQVDRSVLMYASDVLGKPLAAVTLAVGLEEVSSGEIRSQPIEGGQVNFFLMAIDGYALNEPMRIGTARTDAAGRAAQEWVPEGGNGARYEVEARLGDGLKLTAAPVRIQVLTLPDDRPALLLKLDAAPTSPDEVRSSASMPTDVSGSRILAELAERHQFIYLTDVEVRAARAFKLWMRRRVLPEGPLLLLAESADKLPPEARTVARVKDLVSQHPQIVIGIGGTDADARAFAANGLAAIVVPRDLDGMTEIPDGALVTSSWRAAFVHIRLCEMSGELLSKIEGGGEDARLAEQQLELLGRAGTACIDRATRDASLRSAAIYMGGRLRAIHAFRTVIDWSTSLALRDSLLAAWRFGDPSVIRGLYAEPRLGEANPIPAYERWEPVGSPRTQGPDNVVYTVRLIGKKGRTHVHEITCVRQADSTWRILTVD